jgi:hypothetical protein
MRRYQDAEAHQRLGDGDRLVDTAQRRHVAEIGVAMVTPLKYNASIKQG